MHVFCHAGISDIAFTCQDCGWFAVPADMHAAVSSDNYRLVQEEPDTNA
jgi:hypothetical protein